MSSHRSSFSSVSNSNDLDEESLTGNSSSEEFSFCDYSYDGTVLKRKKRFHSFRYEDHFQGTTNDERSRVETHYTQALCMALGAGADQTKEQSSWLKGFLVTKAYPSVLIENVDTLLEQVGELSREEFLEDCHLLAPTFTTTTTSSSNHRCHRHNHRNHGNNNRIAALSVVYDMMQGAAVSGFSSEAQTAGIATVAKAWSVSAFDLEEIRYQVALEEQQRRQRLERMFPKVRNIDHMLMMPRIETHMYLAHLKNHHHSHSAAANRTTASTR